MASIIEVEDISLAYESRKGFEPVLEGFAMKAHEGEYIALIGPSGCGKTTLLSAMEGFLRPIRGRILFAGEDIYGMSKGELARYRNQSIGMVFQFFNLIPNMSACENVSMPARIAGISKAAAQERALELLDMMGIGGLSDKSVSELSGGQQQRVGIARAIVNNPAVIFADEPTGNLDKEAAEGIYELFETLNERMGTTIVVATHDDVLANRASRTVNLGAR